MDDEIGHHLLEQPADLCGVGDVHPLQLIVRRGSDVRQVHQVGRVRELVDVDELVLGMTRNQEAEEVRADETGSSSDEDQHLLRFLGGQHNREQHLEEEVTPRIGIVGIDQALSHALPGRACVHRVGTLSHLRQPGTRSPPTGSAVSPIPWRRSLQAFLGTYLDELAVRH